MVQQLIGNGCGLVIEGWNQFIRHLLGNHLSSDSSFVWSRGFVFYFLNVVRGLDHQIVADEVYFKTLILSSFTMCLYFFEDSDSYAYYIKWSPSPCSVDGNGQFDLW
ncbi:unnamed protein product [Absidia cylindrospora]